jgi:hypothetical protein
MTACIVVAVMVLSWLPSPRLAEQIPMPECIGRWVDSQNHENLRTALPFVLLGLVQGLRMLCNASGRKEWVRSWLWLVLVAGIAEAGQIPLPHRRCDVMDLLYGAGGAGMGLWIVLMFWSVARLFRSLRTLLSII